MPPDFENNPLIKAIDEKRRLAEEAAAAAPRVLSLSTRQAYEPGPNLLVSTITNGKVDLTPPKAKRVRRPRVDKAAIEMAEALLADLRAGVIDGFVAISTIRESSAFDMRAQITCRPGEPVNVAALRYVGGLELMKIDLLQVGDFGLPPEGYDAVQELIDDEGSDQ